MIYVAAIEIAAAAMVVLAFIVAIRRDVKRYKEEKRKRQEIGKMFLDGFRSGISDVTRDSFKERGEILASMIQDAIDDPHGGWFAFGNINQPSMIKLVWLNSREISELHKGTLILEETEYVKRENSRTRRSNDHVD